MMRISKLTDYGVMIMACLAQAPMSRLFQAKEIAQLTSIAPPTVAKLLKTLVKHQLLTSYRGIHGGYQLNVSPEQVTVVDLIQVLEGPIAITECNLGHAACPSERYCGIRAPWQHINKIVTQALDSIKLSDLVKSSHFLTQKSIGFA